MATLILLANKEKLHNTIRKQTMDDELSRNYLKSFLCIFYLYLRILTLTKIVCLKFSFETIKCNVNINP